MDQTKPKCSMCKKSGHGVQFSIFSKYGFGTYCVACEDAVDAALERVRDSSADLRDKVGMK